MTHKNETVSRYILDVLDLFFGQHRAYLALLLIILLCSMILLIGDCRSANTPIADDNTITIEPLSTNDQQTDPIVTKPVDIDEYRSSIIYPSGIFSEVCVDNLRHYLIDRFAHYYKSYVHQCLVAQVHVSFKSRTIYE